MLLLSGPVAQLPGDAFVQAREGTVLRAGPSSNHVGVLTLGPDAVVRRQGDTPAPYVPVFVSSGFPVYVHGDYVVVDAAEQTVDVQGSRLNMRLLPATVGLLPVGQLPPDVTELQLLDVEGDWVRVLAPVTVPLYAPSDALSPAGAGSAERWQTGLAQRGARRQRAMAAHEATDPELARRRELERRVASLDDPSLEPLDQRQLDRLRGELETVLGELPEDRVDLRQQVEARVARLDQEEARRAAAAATLAELERQRAREAAELVKEARALDFGLRFEGKGEALTVAGLVTRRTSEQTEAAIYCIEDARGRTYKLSAAKDIAQLKDLLGKRVELQGRSLALVNVSGPVLIVDEVVKVSTP